MLKAVSRPNMMTERATRWLLAAVLCAATALAQAAERELYVYQMPLELIDGKYPGNDDALQVTLHARDPAALNAYLAQTSVQVDNVLDTAVQVTLAGRDLTTGDASGPHLAATFLIDHDQETVRSLLREVDATLAGRAAVNALSQLVHERMRTTPYGRGFDAASIVARDLQGDCTEHAVLLTALARARGLPARTVVGTVIVSSADSANAFGHAWTEIYADGEWHLADATVSASTNTAVMHYLPVGTLVNEGMGYTMGLYSLINAIPARISAARPVTRQTPTAPAH